MKTARIGLISHDFYPIQGGAGRNFYELFTRLNEKSASLEILAFSPCSNELKNHFSTLHFTNFLPFSQIAFSFFLNFQLNYLARRHKLDLLIFNGGPGGILLLNHPGLPIIYCVNHTYHQQSSFIKSQRWKKIFIPFERISYRKAQKIVAISSTTKEALLSAYTFGEEIITQIPVGIDTAVFRPSAENKIPDSLFYLGRLDQRKGIDLLVETMPQIVKEHPQAVLYIAGKGKLENSLKDFVVQNKLQDNVNFLGHIADDQLAAWYNKCQIQIVPSVFEGLGIVALEGLACGTPVVAARTAGLTDIIDDDTNGRLFEYGNKADLCRKIVDLLKDVDKQKLFRENALEHVKDTFSWDRITDKYLGIIESLINNHGRA